MVFSWRTAVFAVPLGAALVIALLDVERGSEQDDPRQLGIRETNIEREYSEPTSNHASDSELTVEPDLEDSTEGDGSNKLSAQLLVLEESRTFYLETALESAFVTNRAAFRQTFFQLMDSVPPDSQSGVENTQTLQDFFEAATIEKSFDSLIQCGGIVCVVDVWGSQEDILHLTKHFDEEWQPNEDLRVTGLAWERTAGGEYRAYIFERENNPH